MRVSDYLSGPITQSDKEVSQIGNNLNLKFQKKRDNALGISGGTLMFHGVCRERKVNASRLVSLLGGITKDLKLLRWIAGLASRIEPSHRVFWGYFPLFFFLLSELVEKMKLRVMTASVGIGL